MKGAEKIVLVNSAKKVSGAEEYLLDVAENIGGYGHKTSFFVFNGGVLECKAKSYGYRCYPVFGKNPLSVPLAIAAALRTEQADIVLVGRDHNIYPVIAGYLFALPWLKYKPKIVATLHTPTGRRYPFAINFLSGIIATSDYTGQTFYRANPGWEKMAETIYCGIKMPLPQMNKDNPARTRHVLKDRSFPVIGMVGELWKNQAELIDVGSILVNKFPEITITIVGGGEDSALREKIARFGLERNFVLTGRIPREQIPDLFYDLDLSVSTHRNEGFGIVHIESLAASTPVVAYKSGGLTEIIRKGGGVLVDGATEEFAATIVSLLSDNQTRLELGRVGRKVAEDYFNIDVMARNHSEYFNNLCAAI